MSTANKYIRNFIETTCKQIRYKSMHKSISNELLDHIEEQKITYLSQGLDDEAATLKAIEQMGDPVLVGKEFNNSHKPRTNWLILAFTAVLVLVGGTAQYLFSSINPSNSYLFPHFLIYATIGITAFALTFFFDYTILGRYPKTVCFSLLIVTLAGFFIFEKMQWIYSFTLLFIPLFAAVIYALKGKSYLGILASSAFYIVAAISCIIVPSLSSLIFLTISCLIIITTAIRKNFFGGNKLVSYAIIYIPTLIAMLLPIFIIPSFQQRITLMINPGLDPNGVGYQHFMVKKLLYSSKPFGEAVLDSSSNIQNLLPDWSTNFSLTYIITHFGYVAGFSILAIIFIFLSFMFITTMKQKNAFGYLISLSTCIAITIQVIFYILSNFGFITPFASTLPFISYGGSEFIVNMILVGLILSVYRRSDLITDNSLNAVQYSKFFSFKDGKITINLGMKPQNN
jgi:cell division protein FtsW (lipid II flippase)